MNKNDKVSKSIATSKKKHTQKNIIDELFHKHLSRKPYKWIKFFKSSMDYQFHNEKSLEQLREDISYCFDEYASSILSDEPHFHLDPLVNSDLPEALELFKTVQKKMVRTEKVLQEEKNALAILLDEKPWETLRDMCVERKFIVGDEKSWREFCSKEGKKRKK